MGMTKTESLYRIQTDTEINGRKESETHLVAERYVESFRAELKAEPLPRGSIRTITVTEH